jgi:MFS family permease
MVHHLDRMVVTLLLDPIGREFQLSDSQLGLLAGLAYAIPFAIAGIPLGMLVDRVNRVRLLTVLVTVWSSLTAMAAFATGFWTLLLSRVGVAAAESGGTPTNVSIIPTRPARRATRAERTTGTSLGTFMWFSVAGAVATSYGWRAGFLVAGLPGLLLALLLWRTVREPPRSLRPDGQTMAAPPLVHALRIVWSTKSALHVIAGSTIMGMFGIGLMTWLPALMIRNHGANLATVGAIMAFAISPLGAVASLIGGRTGDLACTRAALYEFLALCALVTIPAAAYGILSPTLTGLVVGFAIQTFVQVMMSAPAYATVIHHVPTEIRGLSASVMQVSSNVLGFGVVRVIGLVSDACVNGPRESLRYAMLAFCAVNLWAVLHFLLAARACAKRSSHQTPSMESK